MYPSYKILNFKKLDLECSRIFEKYPCKFTLFLVKIFLSGKHEIFPGKVVARYHLPDRENFKFKNFSA